MAQLREKIWFHEGISSFVKCIIQGVFVGHHNRTIAVSVHHQEWNCARQKSDKTDIE